MIQVIQYPVANLQYQAFFNTDAKPEEGSRPCGGDTSYCFHVSWPVHAVSDVCEAGLQMRADRCGRRHVGLKGKSFRTKMLKNERKSIEQEKARKRQKVRGKEKMKTME